MSVARSWPALLTVLLAVACGRGVHPRPGVPPRHVLLVTASSLRSDHLSCYLYPRPTGEWPSDESEREARRNLALDDAAAQGVLFTEAFAPANRTLPSLEALLTGQSRPVEGESQALGKEARTLAETFAAAGFETASFTSGLELNPRLGASGWERGFEHAEYRFGDTPTLALCEEWLASRSDARPLFLWVHLSGCDPPHDPRAVPPRPDRTLGAYDFARLFTNPAYAGPADGSLQYLEAVGTGTATLGPTDRQHLIDLYDGEVARLASGLRSFLLFASNVVPAGGERDLLADSVLVFAGLTGLELGEHGRSLGSAGSLFLPVMRVPFFVRHPGSLTGSRILSEPVELADVAPTLCEWFDLAPPSTVPNTQSGARAGRSLLPLVDSYIERPFESRPAMALCTTPARAAVLRTREWCLLWSTAGGAQGPALFDRTRDQDELYDVSVSNQDVVARLWPELERALAQAGWR